MKQRNNFTTIVERLMHKSNLMRLLEKFNTGTVKIYIPATKETIVIEPATNTVWLVVNGELYDTRSHFSLRGNLLDIWGTDYKGEYLDVAVISLDFTVNLEEVVLLKASKYLSPKTYF